jgi:hypothetical protein
MLIAAYLGRESDHSLWALSAWLCPVIYFVHTFFVNLDVQQNMRIGDLTFSHNTNQFILDTATLHCNELQFNVNAMTTSALGHYSDNEKSAILKEFRESTNHRHLQVTLFTQHYMSNMDCIDKDFLNAFIKETNVSLTYEQLITLRDEGINI